MLPFQGCIFLVNIDPSAHPKHEPCQIQGVFFNWDPPKNHKYGKKFKYLNWDPPKSSKYGKKLKYPNWDPPKISKYGKHI